MLLRFLPFLDLRDLTRQAAVRDAAAAVAVTFLAVPQAVAYAMIAGLPPVVGLYACAVPTLVGSLFRSSHHVIGGPTNAVSLLVGGAVAAQTGDPLVAAYTIAFLVGALQVGAGWLGLGAIVDYISTSVVMGYISGAAVLIGVGQLGNVTGTYGGDGDLVHQVGGWFTDLGHTHALSVGLAAGTIALVLALKKLAPTWPGTVMVMGLGILLAWGFDLGAHGTRLVGDLAPVPAGLPPLTMPDPSRFGPLMPFALAAALLSLVESSAVARSIASRTGQRIDTSVDFAGIGLANLAAAFTGGYPTSGSLSRSALNEEVGATTRLSGVLSGVMLLAVLLVFGPIIDWTPVPVLAGLLLLLSVSLLDLPRVRELFRAGRYAVGDIAAFLATLIGTFTLDLDKAILLGVGISIVLFLRRARLLVIRELVVGPEGRLQEALPEGCTNRSERIRVLHVEGNLFFGAANELQRAIDDACHQGDPKVVIVRLKRTQGMDLTTATALATAHAVLEAKGRTLLLVGLRPREMHLLDETGLADRIGPGDIYPTAPGWFEAMHDALQRAADIAEPPEGDPIRRYLGVLDAQQQDRQPA
ncbi:MAG: SulP family inorganic anion transporter [Alphaproteobacteria bacterium]|nr:SulP family inorganic anion transporter [Alphaproteobacteria bacterium]